MKKFIVLLLIAAINTGCQTKLEKARTNIARTWKVSMVFEGGQDETATFLNTFGNYVIQFNSSGGFEETYDPFSNGDPLTITGTWSFSDGISKFTLTDGNQSRVYRIDLLDENHLNVTDLGSNNETELQLIPE